MKNPPYMPLYVRDWLADSHVRRMTYEERGIYLELLMFNWEDDGLPIEIDELARLCRVPLKKFQRVWDRLQRHFIQMARDGIRLLYNKKLLDLRGDKSATGAVGSERHRKAALARWHPDEAAQDQSHMQHACENDATSNAKCMQNGCKKGVYDDASHAGAHARHTAIGNANADAKVCVEERGAGGKTDATDTPGTLALQFIDIRQRAVGLRMSNGDVPAFIAVFDELLEVATPQDVEAVLRLLDDKTGKKHWKFGIGFKPDPKKTHALIKQFGSLLADAEDKGFRTIEAETPAPTAPDSLPEFDPIEPSFWDDSMHKISLEMDREDFDNWMKPLRPLGRVGDQIWIATPSTFSEAWVKRNYQDLLQLVLQTPVNIISLEEADGR